MENLGTSVKREVAAGDRVADASLNVRWSQWARCESSFGMALAPSQPGVLALAEEVLQSNGKRLLALFHVAEARDLARAVSALFAAGSPHRQRLQQGRSFARYALVAEPAARHAITEALAAWMAAQSQGASGIAPPGTAAALVAEANCDCDPADCTHEPVRPRRELGRPAFPAGF